MTSNEHQMVYMDVYRSTDFYNNNHKKWIVVEVCVDLYYFFPTRCLFVPC